MQCGTTHGHGCLSLSQYWPVTQTQVLHLQHVRVQHVQESNHEASYMLINQIKLMHHYNIIGWVSCLHYKIVSAWSPEGQGHLYINAQ